MLIATTVICALVLAFFVSFSAPIMGGIMVGIFIILFGLNYKFFVHRVENLNKQLNHLNSSHSSTTRLSSNGNDELTEISQQINEILDNHQTALNYSEQNLKNKSAELNKITSSISSMQQIKTELNDDVLQLTPITNNQKDPLTALPTRTFFNEALNKSISHAKRHNQICAVLLIEIDSVKNINKALGNDVGNYVLNEISNRLAKTLRTEDLVARLDGAEFIVLLSDMNKPKFASVVAEKILQSLTPPIKDFFLSTNIGISIYPDDGSSMEDMLKNADAALYKAKLAGKNTFQFNTNAMDVEARQFIKLETDLRKAIENNELILYYQPKLHIKKGNIAGVEALLRWAHPELGLLNPAQFIPIAEDTGLMNKIGEWALREACGTNKYWQDEGYEHFAVALNLSPKQFQRDDIAKAIETILKDTGLNPKYLELEINESTVMDNIEMAKNRLDAIKAVGVQLSIDHFGAGYTSISHLKQFPISTIKIDQNYIKGIPNNPNDSAITNAFISLAHHLGLEVVAEGVETAEQVQYLTMQQCDMVQGYFLSHPLPQQKIELQFKKLADRALF